MTATTRRALVRVQHAARRLVQAVDALRPQDRRDLPWKVALTAEAACRVAGVTARRLTDLLGPDVPASPETPKDLP